MRTASILIVAASIAVHPAAAACNCGPDFCPDDVRIAQKLAHKKEGLAREYPNRLVSLLDRGEQCVARIERSPDSFHLWTVDIDGSRRTITWTADNETNAMKQVRSGQLIRFWVVHSQRAFSCCGEAQYDSMPDYDRDDDVNTSRAIRCDLATPC